MIQILLLVGAWLFGMVIMGKGKQITINRKNKVITQLKQDRSNLVSEVKQYKNVQKITDSVSTTSFVIDNLQNKILGQVDSLPEEPEEEPEMPLDNIINDKEVHTDGEEQTEEEVDEKVYVLAGDQPNRTKRIADLLQ